MSVEEGDPIKQGLKLLSHIGMFMALLVEEGDPIKQGLKHNYPCFNCRSRNKLKKEIQ